MFEFDVTPDTLVVIFAALMAFIFDWFPGIAKMFNGYPALTKRYVILGVLAIISVVIFGGGCWGWFVTTLACSLDGGITIIRYVFEAVVVSYGVHMVTKPTETKRLKMF